MSVWHPTSRAAAASHMPKAQAHKQPLTSARSGFAEREQEKLKAGAESWSKVKSAAGWRAGPSLLLLLLVSGWAQTGQREKGAGVGVRSAADEQRLCSGKKRGG